MHKTAIACTVRRSGALDWPAWLAASVRLVAPLTNASTFISVPRVHGDPNGEDGAQESLELRLLLWAHPAPSSALTPIGFATKTMMPSTGHARSEEGNEGRRLAGSAVTSPGPEAAARGVGWKDAGGRLKQAPRRPESAPGRKNSTRACCDRLTQGKGRVVCRPRPREPRPGAATLAQW